MKQFVVREHEIEPLSGLPGHLPAGERMLWQGRPSARLVARHSLKNVYLAAYFVVLALWAVAAGLSDDRPLGGILFAVAVLTAIGAVLIGLVELFAWGIERTTLYTITTERLVMRFGVALSMTLNLPYRQMNAVSMAPRGRRGGTIAVALLPGHRLSWLVLWPHVRGWRFSQAEPALICLEDADAVSEILARAVIAWRNSHAGIGRPAAPPMAISTDFAPGGHAAAAE